MDINQIIMYIMVIFMVVGAVDKILGNKFGYGEQFEEGIMAMGALTLAMVGIISLAPVLANVLKPIVVPVYKALGADPSMFATTLLACDMGGYQLAQQLAEAKEIAPFAGLILGAMMGPTIVFTIPVALGIIKKEDHKFLARGVLAGIITIPIGSFVGGLLAGLSPLVVLMNLTPIIIVAILIAIGLKLAPEKMIKGFTYFGKFVTAVITVGLAAIIIETITGIVIIPGMAPLSEGIKVVGDIAIVLAGAYPLVHFITKVFKKPLMKLGSLLGIGEVAAAGMIASLANSIPMFGMMKDMDNRGKIINVAFAVSAAFVFGDHLGFAAGVNKDMIAPMIVAKLVGGASAVVLACLMTPKNESSK
ncbi:MAG: ethanolamine utilization protein EutH [Clostridium argentinense]|uniref:Ethanolamine utilization protein EutH n=1 Tax=Clostridium faecium TaxID=2762223 RepID=A0ABR8YNB0_9CLOT|nr:MULTISPECIES: ethanolamine utilization protein EutH [Clostridium]MBD8045533.1 ethanolamine utilization protein EutH [Clostridium faecium]MBS5824601.1 ethanolamine utilization protein EutH [Clostridium argentinense]MDU1350356.1 ethanolamine utilization protein EutH [Clostridium argentinense]